ncbi:MAG: ABC transporter ATP-binding protein [Chloroflexota bacterium]|nr:ABC transporter ATP-binding protein [Chloroflexota bacterium]
MSGSTLELRGLTIDYGARRALADVSVNVRAGELVALLGPNGAGKSSLLRAVSGADGGPGMHTIGQILIDDVPRDEFDRQTLARRIAVVPGQTRVAFALRVEDLVALGRVPHEHPLLGPREVDRHAIAAAIERVGIDRLRGRDVRELSLGERQLCVLAMAVAQSPRLLLLDEPTVHLDLKHQVAVMELLRDLSARDGVTVVAVMHDINLAAHFFGRLLLLDHGRLVADGRPSEVLSPDRIRTVYGVDPALVAVPTA